MAGKSLNKVQLIGNLGKDADLRYTASGLAVASFSLATNERFKGSDSDEWKERTEWHNIVIWGRTAENIGEYLVKGTKIYVEGRLQTRSWDDQNGMKRYTTEIVARDIILLGGRGDSSAPSQRPPHPADTYSSSPAAPAYTGSGPSTPPQPEPPADSEDIPF